jgi:hypothetical protein
MVAINIGALATRSSIEYHRLSALTLGTLNPLPRTVRPAGILGCYLRGGYEIMSPRGSALNISEGFAPPHQVVRANHITG